MATQKTVPQMSSLPLDQNHIVLAFTSLSSPACKLAMLRRHRPCFLILLKQSFTLIGVYVCICTVTCMLCPGHVKWSRVWVFQSVSRDETPSTGFFCILVKISFNSWILTFSALPCSINKFLFIIFIWTFIKAIGLGLLSTVLSWGLILVSC